MNELKVFSNTEFGELGVMVIDGKEYFPATQCARVLGYARPADAISAHCKGVCVLPTPSAGGVQNTKFIPEGDLYRLIIGSKLPAAEKFERWVFDEVLPSIRRGGYIGNAEELIARTATAVVSEVMKQLIPVLKGQKERESEYLFDLEDINRPKRKQTGIICKLDPEIRKKVDEMLLSDKYGYDEIKSYLAAIGISISSASICRYARHFWEV